MFQNKQVTQTKTCRHCSASFPITDKDMEFYEKVSPTFPAPLSSKGEGLGVRREWDKVRYLIPTPTLCPYCRDRRRLSFLNQLKLYKNTCLKCNKDIVSRFSPASGIKNYCNACWSAEDWDQLEHGTEMDFSRSFFEQVGSLIRKTPFQNLIGSASNIENNAVYTNHTSEIHDSYFVFEANTINASFYSFAVKNSDSLMDCAFVGNSEHLYECVDSYDMFNSFYSSKSYGCKYSYFLNSCYNCSYCIGCVNLHNKDYHVFNEPVTKETYEALASKLGNSAYLHEWRKKWDEFLKGQIRKSSNLVGTENCSWNNIVSSRNCTHSFDVLGCQDCKYANNVNYSEDLFDISSYGEKSNRMFESVSVGRYSNNILFSSIVWKGENLLYCIDVKKSKHCFWCVNLEWKQYCILNKQYTREEYEVLVPKIIEHMIKTREWGEFFPSSLSPFGYNETVAQEYYPLDRRDVSQKHPYPGGTQIFNWSDYEAPFPKVEKIIPADKLPDDITKIPDDILNWAIECEATKKPFRIIQQELEFYRKHHLPIPRRHPDQRHLDRMALRNPRKLFERKCDKCGVEMITTYSPERPEKVYCEDCYNKEVVG